MDMPSLTNPLRGLILPRDSRSKRVSSYDTTGANHDSWPLEPGETKTLADIEGPGCINHIWMTSGSDEPAWTRRVLLRMFWDDEEQPSVEVPMGDFFGVGHGEIRQWEALPMNMTGSPGGDRSAFNCWWPMPFASRARLEIVNEGEKSRPIYFYVDYEQYDDPLAHTLHFHSCWRRENPCKGWAKPGTSPGDKDVNATPNLTGEDNYLILDAEGRGHYVRRDLASLAARHRLRGLLLPCLRDAGRAGSLPRHLAVQREPRELGGQVDRLPLSPHRSHYVPQVHPRDH